MVIVQFSLTCILSFSIYVEVIIIILMANIILCDNITCQRIFMNEYIKVYDNDAYYGVCNKCDDFGCLDEQFEAGLDNR